MNLQGVLLTILGDEGETMAVSKIRDGFQIKFGKMYSAPPLNFGTLEALSNLFGTKKIDVDDYSHGGCESCDWGSDYGHEIQIYNPIKNEKEIAELVGEDLLKGEITVARELTPEESAWEDQIARDPKNTALRLVYSDWLEEHGNLKGAEYQRAVANFKQ